MSDSRGPRITSGRRVGAELRGDWPRRHRMRKSTFTLLVIEIIALLLVAFFFGVWW
jgi:hypothetical protein